MAEDEHKAERETAGLNRRDVLTGATAAVVASALPGEAEAHRAFAVAPDQQMHTLGATYLDPVYKHTFDKLYGYDSIVSVHNAILAKYGTNRSKMTWGDYQRDIMPTVANWGSAEAFYSWPYFVNEVRNDIEKQQTIFSSDPSTFTNPFDASKNQSNLQAHLDEVVRVALYDYAVEVKITVGSAVRRHHALTTTWSLRPVNMPSSGGQEISSLSINIDCPQGGWQAYAFSRNSASPFTQFSAQWKVPPIPASPDAGQIIFIFNGLESLSDKNGVGGILQPVLQFTNNQWAVRSWYMRADFDPTQDNLQTPPALNASQLKYNVPFVKDSSGNYPDNRSYSMGQNVNPNDIITGSIAIHTDTSTGVASYVCSILVNGNPTTTNTTLAIPVSGIPAFVYAVCAVESYKIPPYTHTATEQYYPTDPIKLSNFSLATQAGQVSSVSWTRSKTLGRDYSATVLDSGATVVFTVA